jgi:predicted dehydrogenase
MEINGEKGALKFDFERMNELQWWDNTLEPRLRGWSTISCTTPGIHPYCEAYWPAGHGLGYEHTFISQAADIVRTLGGRKPVVPLPDFADAYETQRVLHAATLAARQRKAVRMSRVK